MEKEALWPDDEVKEIFNTVAKNLPASRKLPGATYRLQFNHQFKFSDAKSIVSYLHELGISDVYASPYFMAQKGSLHGYDILNPNLLNPEIGTEPEYEEFIRELESHGMGQILDIVPNHMCITGNENIWWMDVLENGPSSLYADFFDIDWNPVKGELKNKVLLPILGAQYGQVLENQELTLKFEGGSFSIYYGDQKLPLDPLSYNRILKFRVEDWGKKMEKEHPHLQELFSIITALEHLPPQTEKDPEKIQERRREKEIIKKRILKLYEESGPVRVFIDENVLIFHGEKGKARSFDLLDRLLQDQAYRLSHWRVAAEEINYRRFFDINDLAAIRMEHLPVFLEVHKLVFKLIGEKKASGLRVDHPDGLYNPAEYFFRLQKGCFIQICRQVMEKKMGNDELVLAELGRLYEEELFKNPSPSLRAPFYIVGEKILTKNEKIPEDWPIWGTVGYVFLNPVNGIFVDPGNGKNFESIYSRFTGTKVNYQDLVYEKKKLIMLTSMAGEINTLGHYLNRLSEKNRHTRDFTLNSLRAAITEVIACFPVYRTYVNSCGVVERDRRYLEQAVASAERRNPALSATIFDFLENILLLRYPEDFEEEDKMEWLDFVMRFQQVTGPVMAKGLEDTVFYVYNQLVSLNEVGGNPERFGTPLDAFHGQNIERTQFWPYGLITTSTHDSKRSEDVRARLNVLSEIPQEWRKCLMRWRQINRRKKTLVEGQWVPDRNEEYLLYQTLLGVWPLYPAGASEDFFKKRIKDYMLKAVREAKVNTSWISPNGPYEDALLKFIDALLSHRPFLNDFELLAKKVAYFGMLNSLSQTLLKITCPGTPDFFQGTEIWDFRLVDPDNRRPVDFALRQEMLKTLKTRMVRYKSDLASFTRELFQEWPGGAIKLFLTLRGLNYRKENCQLFQEGAYTPLVSEGRRKEQICAFARHTDKKAGVVIIPRFLTHISQNAEEVPFGREIWKDSWVVIPDEMTGGEFFNIFTGETVREDAREGEKVLPLDAVLANFPVALLERKESPG